MGKVVSFRLKDAELRRVDRAASQYGMTRSDLIKTALRVYLWGEKNVEKIVEASISGKKVSCDRCGAVVDRSKALSIYTGDKGQKVDYCPKCFDRGVRKHD